MPQISIADLFAKIGQLTVENDALRQENDDLRASAQSEPDKEMEPEKPGPKER